jgi:hypothetical protein
MSTRKHVVKIIGLAVMAALAISAFASASASAATWTVEGAKLEEGTAKGVSASAKLKTGTTAVLEGELLGQEFVLTSTTLSSSSGTIFQEGTKAKDSGVLEFSGLSVDKPSPTCAVESPIKTKSLTSELVDHSGSTKAYDKFFPEEGEVFATIKVSGCAVAGSYNVKGVVYGEAEAWGVSLASQPLKFNPTINATLGGSLTLGTKAAKLSAEGVNTLASGKAFSADT